MKYLVTCVYLFRRLKFLLLFENNYFAIELFINSVSFTINSSSKFWLKFYF